MNIFDVVPEYCPSCGKTTIAEIVYRRPSSEMMTATQLGQIVLGSGTEAEDSPQWICQDRQCGYKF